MILYLFVYFIMVLIVLWLLKVPPFGQEWFMGTVSPKFVRASNTEFRGINLLGVNSDDGHFACGTEDICQQVCERNTECKGYSYYQPGQRCYMFMSGDFVPSRPGFFSGKRV